MAGNFTVAFSKAVDLLFVCLELCLNLTLVYLCHACAEWVKSHTNEFPLVAGEIYAVRTCDHTG